MSRRILPVVAALLLLGAAHSTAYAQSGSDITRSRVLQDTTRSWFAYDSCQHENVHLTATQHVVQYRLRNGTSTLMVYHLNYSDGRGVGVNTGLTYILSAALQQVTLADVDGVSQDFVLNNRLNGQGGAPDLWLHQIQTITRDGTNYSITTKADTLICR